MVKLKNIGLIFFGIILALVILEGILRVTGFIFLIEQRYENRITNENTYHILALGESTTGDFHNNQSTWPKELEIILNNRNKDIKFEVFNEGIPGVTTSFLVASLEDNLEKYKPDMVITMMGTNDNERYIIPREIIVVREAEILFKDFRVYKLIKFIAESFSNKVGLDGTIRNHDENEEKLKEILEKNPYNYSALEELGKLYRIQENYKKQADVIKRMTEVEAKQRSDKMAMISSKGYNETEKRLKDAVEKNPGNKTALLELEWFYYIHDNYKGQEEVLEKISKVNATYKIYLILGNLYYYHMDKPEEALTMYLRVFNITREANEYLFLQIGKLYMSFGEFTKAYEYLKLVEFFNPNGTEASTELAWYYLNTDNANKTEEIFNNILEINPDHLVQMYSEMGFRYEKQDQIEKAEEMFQKAAELRRRYYTPVTQQNYQKLYDMLRERGIKLIVMQYPTLNVDELRSMFERGEGIIFVSNEENFKSVLADSPYEEIFVDRIKQSWGHATKRGNQLIAENLAPIILDEVTIPINNTEK